MGQVTVRGVRKCDGIVQPLGPPMQLHERPTDAGEPDGPRPDATWMLPFGANARLAV